MNIKIFVRSSLLQILALTVCFAPVGQAQLVERPLITARHAVVTSDEPLASMAGMRILQEGGNAFDAAGRPPLPWVCLIRACLPSAEMDLQPFMSVRRVKCGL